METPEYWEDEHYAIVPSRVHSSAEWDGVQWDTRPPMGVHLCKSCGGVAFDRGVHDRWHERMERTHEAVYPPITAKYERKW